MIKLSRVPRIPQTKWKREKEKLLSSKAFRRDHIYSSYTFLNCRLLFAKPSLCFIIQNLSISSAVLPGILPAISPHLHNQSYFYEHTREFKTLRRVQHRIYHAVSRDTTWSKFFTRYL